MTLRVKFLSEDTYTVRAATQLEILLVIYDNINKENIL